MIKQKILLAALSFIIFVTPVKAQIDFTEHDGTFSIIGRDPTTGELGIGVHSKTVAVGSRTRGGKGGVAIFAHQAASNPMYSMIGIELLEAGMSPQQALDMMLRSDKERNRRQVAILDILGRTAAWTSPDINDWKGHKCGMNYCAQGNTLTGPEVVAAMSDSFESTSGPLVERLLDALDAAQAAGGDKRGMQSASLMVLKPLSGAGGYSDRLLDLRVDEHKQPLRELRRVLAAFLARESIRGVRPKINEGKLKEALDLAIRTRDLFPEGDSAWIAIANVQLRLGNRTEALRALEHAISLNPANKVQLLSNEDFVSLYDDPDFKNMVRNNESE